MPYASDKQRRFFNANRDSIGGKTVDEFNKASAGMKLPEKAPAKPKKRGVGARVLAMARRNQGG